MTKQVSNKQQNPKEGLSSPVEKQGGGVPFINTPNGDDTLPFRLGSSQPRTVVNVYGGEGGGVPMIAGGDGPNPLFSGFSCGDSATERSDKGIESRQRDLFSAKDIERESYIWPFHDRLPIYFPMHTAPVGYIVDEPEAQMRVVADETGSWSVYFYVKGYLTFSFYVTLNAYDEHLNNLGAVTTPWLTARGSGVFTGFAEGGRQLWISEKLKRIHFWKRHVSGRSYQQSDSK